MYGATKEQWEHFVSIGLTHDLLPVVSNPTSPLSPDTALQSPGKVPSKFNNNGHVVGISGWSNKTATETGVNNWSSNPDYGICIQTRHLRALDVDIDAYEISNQVMHTIMAHVPNAVFRSRPNSGKFIFPFFLEGTFAKRVIHSDLGNIEFLGNGQQFVAAGTHPSGVKYVFPLQTPPTLTEDEFEFLFNLIADQFGNEVSRSKITKHHPHNELPDERKDWLINNKYSLGIGPVGQVFAKCPLSHRHSDPDHVDSKSTFCYFPKGSSSYPNGRFWCSHTHGSITPDYEYEHAFGMDFSDAIDFEDDTPEPETYVPVDVPNGLIKDTVSWIVSSALKPQPELALLSVICFAGAVFGRRYELNELKTRTNLYGIAIAGTGSGKDHPRKCIKALADEANLNKFVGPDDLVSGQGIFTSLTKQPSVVMLYDEIGMLFEQIKGKSAQGYMSVTSKVLTQLYSSSSGIYKGGAYADPKREPIVLHSPNLCIYGTTTETKILSFINEEVVNSGELNRYIFLKPQFQIPPRNYTPASQAPPQELINRWGKFASEAEVYDLTAPSDQPIEPTRVDTDVDFIPLWEYEDKMQMTLEDGSAPLFARYTENIIKIAMIFAISENYHSPLLNSTHIEVGRTIVDKSIAFMRLLAMNKPSEEGSLINQIYKFIKKEPVTRREICRKMRSTHSYEIDKVLQTLIDQGAIEVKKDKGEKKTITVYQAVLK